jgi:diacylglycerol kinase (ATP)
MKLLLVFNPHAAGGRAEKRLPTIRKRLEAAGIDCTIAVSRHAGHVEQLVSEASPGDLDAVAVAGGDGTLSQALNGLMSHPEGERVPLGLIPVGTGNSFARDIGLQPDGWREGIDLIIRGHTRRVDIGKIECGSGRFYFLNVAGFGFVTDAGRTAARLKFTGRSAYTLATLWRCLRLRSHQLNMDVDGRVIHQDNLFVEVSNSRYTGTSFLIAPAAKIDDGCLDITIVRRLSRLRLLRLFPSVFKGRHVEFDEVTTASGRVISIHGPDGLGLMVDGEFRGATPARIECLPGAVEMFSA